MFDDIIQSIFGYGNNSQSSGIGDIIPGTSSLLNQSNFNQADPFNLGFGMEGLDPGVLENSLKSMGSPVGGGLETLQGINSLTGSAANLMGIFDSFRQAELMKDAFNFSKRMARKNLENQTKSYNTVLADRQRARMSSDPSQYGSLESYLDENRLRT